MKSLIFSAATAFATMAMLSPALAHAQQYGNPHGQPGYQQNDSYDDSYSDDDDNNRTPPRPGGPEYYAPASQLDSNGVPYAGRDLAHDYIRDEYYTYQGQPSQDRRSREQEGYRDGTLHTTPGGYGYRNGCGCTYYRQVNAWGEHQYRRLGDRHYDHATDGYGDRHRGW